MFYTYVWLREDGTPYYVGKGSGYRAYNKHRVGNAPPLGRIVFYVAKDEGDAFETEIDLIWYYGRKDLGTGCLRNLTDGGENPPRTKKGHCKGRPSARKGLKFPERSEEVKRKISNSLEILLRNKPELRKGKTPWNKGIKGAQVAWNKGIGKSLEEKRLAHNLTNNRSRDQRIQERQNEQSICTT
jgi:hypothetical protein